MDTMMSDTIVTAKPHHERGTPEQRVAWQRWITDTLDETGMTQASLARKLGTSRSIVSQWIHDGMLPRPVSCRKLADVLGISVQEVMAAAGWLQQLDDDREALIGLVRDLPESQLDAARSYFTYLLTKREE